MTTAVARRAEQRQVLEANAPLVYRVLGRTRDNAEAARQLARYGIFTQRDAVWKFVKRHPYEVQTVRAGAIAKAVEEAGFDVQERLDAMSWMARGILAELDARGFMWEEPHGSDRVVLRVPTAAIKAVQDLVHEIALQRDELPRNHSTRGGVEETAELTMRQGVIAGDTTVVTEVNLRFGSGREVE